MKKEGEGLSDKRNILKYNTLFFFSFSFFFFFLWIGPLECSIVADILLMDRSGETSYFLKATVAYEARF
jgi:hypothetical protein